MKIYLIFIAFGVVTFSCLSNSKRSVKEEMVREFINCINIGNAFKIDSIISYDFKFLTDSTITEKEAFLTFVVKPVANTVITIEEIETVDGTVKTKEKITDDAIAFLNIEPTIRKREYHFNDQNLIKTIYTLEQFESPEYKIVQKKFLLWAYQEYPDFVEAMIEKAKKGDNIDEERRFLLTKLKAKGISILDMDKLKENDNPKNIENKVGNDDNLIDSFKNSYVITQVGLNLFPFGEHTVQELENAIKNSVMSDGSTPIIKGWTKVSNVYTLKVNYAGENVSFVFEHLLNNEGKTSVMSGRVNGEIVDGVQMFQLIPNLVK